MYKSKTLEAFFQDHGFLFSPQQLQNFADYAKLLVSWNEKMNLTAITDPQEILIKHFLDSLLPFSLAELPPGAKLIDVGTGAGFPGIPAKIFRQDLSLTLLDSLKKRLVFLEEVLAQCQLSAQCVHSRAEDAGKNPLYREQFDAATARAVAHLRELSEYCLPFVRVGGFFYALKGSGGDAEWQQSQHAVELLGGKLRRKVLYALPDGSERTLFLIEKKSQTPTKYPRTPAQIAKSPL